MIAELVRSGLVETAHDGAVLALDRQGSVLAAHGDVDRPFFIRSSAKPFQAFVVQRSGAELAPLELAMACSSHRGQPVHLALVTSMLAKAGLDESALQCPPAWPLGERGERLVAASGATGPRSLWHNCSGKHAAFLRACVARGWPVATYLDPEHPLQLEIRDLLTDLGGIPVDPVGVDGCGAPVMRTTVAAMTRMFAHLAFNDEFQEVFMAMHRYPALIGNTGEGDTEIAISIDAAAKGGAAGCIGVAVRDTVAVSAKSWEGSSTVANLAATHTLERLGLLSGVARERLSPVIAPPVLGGGAVVGQMRPAFDPVVT